MVNQNGMKSFLIPELVFYLHFHIKSSKSQCTLIDIIKINHIYFPWIQAILFYLFYSLLGNVAMTTMVISRHFSTNSTCSLSSYENITYYYKYMFVFVYIAMFYRQCSSSSHSSLSRLFPWVVGSYLLSQWMCRPRFLWSHISFSPSPCKWHSK